MKKNCDCSFMFGQQTDPETVRELHNALQTKTAIQKEFIAYKKDGKVISKLLQTNIGTQGVQELFAKIVIDYSVLSTSQKQIYYQKVSFTSNYKFLFFS